MTFPAGDWEEVQRSAIDAWAKAHELAAHDGKSVSGWVLDPNPARDHDWAGTAPATDQDSAAALSAAQRMARHGGHTPAGVAARVLQRILALTAVIWHNDKTGQPVKRSLLAYDHWPLGNRSRNVAWSCPSRLSHLSTITPDRRLFAPHLLTDCGSGGVQIICSVPHWFGIPVPIWRRRSLITP
jgi:hypothetical protein